jgi:SAM-dependent methyltransferase
MSGRPEQGAQDYFERLWKHDEVDWASLDSGDWRAVYERQFALLDGRSYPRALELGCGAGDFTARLAALAGHLIAVDIAPTAIRHARARVGAGVPVEFRVADVMDCDVSGEGPWDLVVMNDTIYYLGSVYTFVEVAWLAAEIFAGTAPGGRFLMANAASAVEDENGDMRPWIIRTYRDLFLNVGFGLEQELAFPVGHAGGEFEALICLFARP